MKRIITAGLIAAALSATAAACAVPPQAPGVVSSSTTVTGVVDGDTVDIANGERIRIIGIDAQETGTGACATTATERLRSMVLGQQVTLTSGARDDHDRYGRLLRYVDVVGHDAGRVLIGDGLAVARYDSRDGYGGHTREADYVAYDALTPNCTSADAPAGAGSDPRFGTCAEAKRAGYGPYIQGVDPEYAWYSDADHDGRVCE